MNPFTRQWSALTSIIFISLLIAANAPSWADDQTNEGAHARKAEAEHGQYGWVVDPTAVGPDIPPIGRSLFDFLIRDPRADKPAYDIPFPFSALLEKIDRSLQVSGGDTGIKKVLIPLGRSLQRPAALNEFFIYPRAVAAVVSGPKFETGKAGLMLKDRIYIGYHEKSAVLEIISYNEAVGRFEFQLVKNYRAGQQAEVYYARRAICMACHQNQSPIFSRPSWQETSANPVISEYLQATGKAYYGFTLTHGVDIPNAIDEATERANLFSLQQWLWREGCGLENNLEATKCRAALLNAILQYRFSSDQYFDEISEGYQQFFLPVLKKNWTRKWPNGVALPNPDIPNRDPFLRRVRSKELKPNKVDYMHVEAVFEPINIRAPLEVWSALTPDRMNMLVKGLSGFLAEADIVRLDTQLKKLAGTGDLPTVEQFQATCQLRSKAMKDGLRRINFNCEKPPSSASGFATEGKLYIRDAKVERGEVSRLDLDTEQTSRHYLIQQAQNTGQASELTLIKNQSQARLSDGRRIESLALDWQPTDLNTQIYISDALITLVDDYEPIRQGVENLLKQTLDGHNNALSSQPFRRASILQALFAQLNMTPLEWCCEASEDMPLAEVEHVPSAVDQLGVTGGLPSDFYKHCAQCHLTREQFPPNFLATDTDNSEAKIAQCAERIYYRLSMWRLDQSLRPKTVMPPELSLNRNGVSAKDWQSSDTINGLLAYMEGVLEKKSGSKAGVADVLNQDYEHLRPCLQKVVAYTQPN